MKRLVRKLKKSSAFFRAVERSIYRIVNTNKENVYQDKIQDNIQNK